MGPRNRKPKVKAPAADAATTAPATTTAGTKAPEPTPKGQARQSPAPKAQASQKSAAPKVKPPKEQYHHIVPRFMLKKFIIEGHVNPDPKRWNKKNAALLDPIHCYHVPTRTFSIEPIATSYGITDLYLDSNADDVYEVEKKLSVLESQAAKAISTLHNTIESRPPGGSTPGEPEYFRIKRKYLNHLRKFMFIMYFRNDGCKEVHFSEEHPDNASGAAWIRAFRRRNNLEPSEVWLHVLKHYLSTSHTDLITQGEKAEAQLGPRGMAGFKHGLDPDIEHGEIIQYIGEAHNYFLAVWEAADNEEFVISNNAFGLCEWMHALGGKIYPFHRFYIISPRVALVLCSTPLRPDIPPNPEVELMYRKSMLWGAPHKSPRVTKDGEIVGRGGRVETYEEDIMEYEIVKLSPEFTQRVNGIIIGNARVDTGTITFRTPAAMLRTLEHFSKNKNFNNQDQYLPLVEKLLEMTGAKSSNFKVVPNPNPLSKRKFLKPPKGEDESDKPGFWELNVEMLRTVEANSDPDKRQFFRIPVDRLIERAALKIAQTDHDINPKPARLRRFMPNEDCAQVLFTTKKFITQFLCLPIPGLLQEITMVAFLNWLLAERRLMFEILETRFSVLIMQYDYDEPDKEKIEEEYRNRWERFINKDGKGGKGEKK